MPRFENPNTHNGLHPRACVAGVEGEFYRIVRGVDVAPRFPLWLRGYRHPEGTRLHLGADGLERDPVGWFDMLITPGIVFGKLDHGVGRYVQDLGRAG